MDDEIGNHLMDMWIMENICRYKTLESCVLEIYEHLTRKKNMNG